ncbi:hypothetical protein TC41_0037 [Alicyclobacillus acidocaldarius subsp. acidocaldarius Tc-4-1]|uniref:Uncharacterized protein n=1 Tax=Alicyclobacillus acidocaldarius (strain Tc-4-1) TaxID=1048834 RepID=F8IHQ0_ALIAT|nr:hypothetical protein TC41_0037 [Alicyclobacillus acidocaldarius subsp. acidocaldarius Tc-4-1]
MGPPTISAEQLMLCHHASVPVTASMGPPTISAEQRPYSDRSYARGYGFNGAADDLGGATKRESSSESV